MDTIRLITQYVLEGITPEQWEFIKTIPYLSAERFKAAKEAATGTTPEQPPVVVVPTKEEPPVIVPPVVEPLVQLMPIYNEATRALTFRQKGGTGTLVTHEMPGVTGRTEKTVVYVDEGPARERKEIYQIRAFQDGKEAEPVWFSLASYTLVDNPKTGTVPDTPPPTKPDTKPDKPHKPNDDATTQPVDVSKDDETNETNLDNGQYFEIPDENQKSN